MKTFQIRNVDSKGHGSFEYVDVPDDATKEQTEAAVNELMTEKLERHNLYRYFGQRSFFNTRGAMKIVEYDRTTNKAKRGGLKGRLFSGHTVAKGINILTGNKFEREYFSFSAELEVE